MYCFSFKELSTGLLLFLIYRAGGIASMTPPVTPPVAAASSFSMYGLFSSSHASDVSTASAEDAATQASLAYTSSKAIASGMHCFLMKSQHASTAHEASWDRPSRVYLPDSSLAQFVGEVRSWMCCYNLSIFIYC